MKKKIIIVCVLILLIIVLLLIPKDVYLKIFNKEDPVTNEESSLVYQTIYAENEDGILVGIKVGLDSIEEDVISQKWDILTINSNLLPKGYSSPIISNTKLLDYQIDNNVLTLNLTEDFINSNGRKAIECLAWNFCCDDIDEVVVKINDQVVKEINNYQFNKINKNIGVNLTFDTPYLFETDYSTVIFYENDQILPVTYFFENDFDKITYTLNKLFDTDDTLKEVVSGSLYSYEITDELLVINIDTSCVFSEMLTESINNTIKLNFDVSGYIINGIDSVILEQSFIEDTTN